MGRSRQALSLADVAGLNWSKGGGLLPAIVQDARTLQVLMHAWVNADTLAETLQSGDAVFWSRSRNTRWRKGDTSGNRLVVRDVLADCDGDTLLMRVEPAGPACHEGSVSCFGAEDAPGDGRLARLEAVIAARAAADPAESWTARLLAEGPRRAAQKVGEEGVETALAGAAGSREEVCEEAADLIYHLLVLLRSRNIALDEVLQVLARRAGPA